MSDNYDVASLGWTLAILAAILIIVGRFGRRRPLLMSGFVLLTLAGLLVVWEWMQGTIVPQ